MSRVCKKIVGLLGLALVVGITTVASGIPPTLDVSAGSNNVNVQFKVYSETFAAQVLSPVDGSVRYSNDTVDATISYSFAESIEVTLVFPDGSSVVVDSRTIPSGSTAAGTYTIPLPVTSSQYGNYKIEISGTDLTSSPVLGGTTVFSFRAITVEDINNDVIDVNYGSSVCQIGFQVYLTSDTARSNPLLDPEFMVNAPQSGNPLPNNIKVQIPGLAALGLGEFDIVATAYDCANNPLDSDFTTSTGVLPPPKTGAISILGITISRTDYVITGLIAFVFVTLFALFLLRRKKKIEL